MLTNAHAGLEVINDMVSESGGNRSGGLRKELVYPITKQEMAVPRNA